MAAVTAPLTPYLATATNGEVPFVLQGTGLVATAWVARQVQVEVSALPVAGNTLVIDDFVFTWAVAPNPSNAFEVLIGASVTACVTNLAAALRACDALTTYGVGVLAVDTTLPNVSVTVGWIDYLSPACAVSATGSWHTITTPVAGTPEVVTDPYYLGLRVFAEKDSNTGGNLSAPTTNNATRLLFDRLAGIQAPGILTDAVRAGSAVRVFLNAASVLAPILQHDTPPALPPSLAQVYASDKCFRRYYAYAYELTSANNDGVKLQGPIENIHVANVNRYYALNGYPDPELSRYFTVVGLSFAGIDWLEPYFNDALRPFLTFHTRRTIRRGGIDFLSWFTGDNGSLVDRAFVSLAYATDADPTTWVDTGLDFTSIFSYANSSTNFGERIVTLPVYLAELGIPETVQSFKVKLIFDLGGINQPLSNEIEYQFLDDFTAVPLFFYNNFGVIDSIYLRKLPETEFNYEFEEITVFQINNLVARDKERFKNKQVQVLNFDSGFYSEDEMKQLRRSMLSNVLYIVYNYVDVSEVSLTSDNGYRQAAWSSDSLELLSQQSINNPPLSLIIGTDLINNAQ